MGLINKTFSCTDVYNEGMQLVDVTRRDRNGMELDILDAAIMVVLSMDLKPALRPKYGEALPTEPYF